MRGCPRVFRAFSFKSVLKRFHPLTVIMWLIEDRVVFSIYTLFMLMLLGFFEGMGEVRD